MDEEVEAAAVIEVNKLLGDSVPSVSILDGFIAKFEAEREELLGALDTSSKGGDVEHDSSEKLEEAVKSALNDLKRLEEDQNAALEEAKATLGEGLDIYSSLVPIVQKARAARRAASYESVVEQVQARVVEMENAVTRQNYGAAVDSYVDLLSVARKYIGLDGAEKKPAHLSRYLMETSSVWHAFLKQHLVKELEDSLSLLKWPFTDATGSGQAAQVALESEHVPKFEACFGMAAQLEPPPPAQTDGPSLPIRVMLKPLVKRFKFHFTGTKETNNREKPEWFFTQVSNWARDCLPFVEGPPMALKPSAPQEFLLGLVELAVDKLYSDFGAVEEYDDEGEAILAHAIEEALLFHRELRLNHGKIFPASNPGVLSVLTSARVFSRWLEIERKSAGEKVDTILASETAFVAEEDELLGFDTEVSKENDWKVTECADRFLSMLMSITDRYQCLVQPGHRLQFAELQADLAEDFRVRLLQLAREERKDPLNSNLCPILNTISYLLQVLTEWSDSPVFVELQFYREKSGFPSRLDDEHVGSTGSSTPIGGLFDDVITLFQHSEDDLVASLQARVGEDISAQALEYKRDRWFATGTFEKNRISSSGCGLLNIIRDRLRLLKKKLNRKLFQKIVSRVAADVAKFLVDDFACETRFSQDGGRQFGVDLTRGFIVVFSEFDPKPAKYFREASEAALLLNLAKGAAILLRDELKVSKGDEGGRNSLRELGVYRLNVIHALKIVENRLNLDVL